MQLNSISQGSGVKPPSMLRQDTFGAALSAVFPAAGGERGGGGHVSVRPTENL